MFVALGIQNAIRVHRIIWHVARTALHIFPYYLVIGMIFEKKNWMQHMCFDFLYNVCLKHSHSENNSAWFDHKCT